jgi:hypothetical protein
MAPNTPAAASKAPANSPGMDIAVDGFSQTSKTEEIVDGSVAEIASKQKVPRQQ